MTITKHNEANGMQDLDVFYFFEYHAKLSCLVIMFD